MEGESQVCVLLFFQNCHAFNSIFHLLSAEETCILHPSKILVSSVQFLPYLRWLLVNYKCYVYWLSFNDSFLYPALSKGLRTFCLTQSTEVNACSVKRIKGVHIAWSTHKTYIFCSLLCSEKLRFSDKVDGNGILSCKSKCICLVFKLKTSTDLY